MPKYRLKKRGQSKLKPVEQETKQETPLTSEQVRSDMTQYKKFIREFITQQGLQSPPYPILDELKDPGNAPKAPPGVSPPPKAPLKPTPPKEPYGLNLKNYPVSKGTKDKYEAELKSYNTATPKYERDLTKFAAEMKQHEEEKTQQTTAMEEYKKLKSEHTKVVNEYKNTEKKNKEKIQQYEETLQLITKRKEYLSERLDKYYTQLEKMIPGDTVLSKEGNEALGRNFAEFAKSVSRFIAVGELQDFDPRDLSKTGESKQLERGLTAPIVETAIKELSNKTISSIEDIAAALEELNKTFKKIDYLPRNAEIVARLESKDQQQYYNFTEENLQKAAQEEQKLSPRSLEKAPRDHIQNLTDEHVKLIRQLELAADIQRHIHDLDNSADEIHKKIDAIIEKATKPKPMEEKERLSYLERELKTLTITMTQARFHRTVDLRTRARASSIDEVTKNGELLTDFDDSVKEFAVVIKYANERLGRDSLVYKEGKDKDPIEIEIDRLNASTNALQKRLNTREEIPNIQRDYEALVRHKDRIQEAISKRTDITEEISKAFNTAKEKLLRVAEKALIVARLTALYSDTQKIHAGLPGINNVTLENLLTTTNALGALDNIEHAREQLINEYPHFEFNTLPIHQNLVTYVEEIHDDIFKITRAAIAQTDNAVTTLETSLAKIAPESKAFDDDIFNVAKKLEALDNRANKILEIVQSHQENLSNAQLQTLQTELTIVKEHINQTLGKLSELQRHKNFLDLHQAIQTTTSKVNDISIPNNESKDLVTEHKAANDRLNGLKKERAQLYTRYESAIQPGVVSPKDASTLKTDINTLDEAIAAKRDALANAANLYSQKLKSEIETANHDLVGITPPEPGKPEFNALLTVFEDQLDEMELTAGALREKVAATILTAPQREELTADLETLDKTIAAKRSLVSALQQQNAKLEHDKEKQINRDSLVAEIDALRREIVISSNKLHGHLDHAIGKKQGDCLDEKLLVTIESAIPDYQERVKAIITHPRLQSLEQEDLEDLEELKQTFGELQDTAMDARADYNEKLRAVVSEIKSINLEMIDSADSLEEFINPATDISEISETVAEYASRIQDVNHFIHNQNFNPNKDNTIEILNNQHNTLTQGLDKLNDLISNGVAKYFNNTLQNADGNANNLLQGLPIIKNNINYTVECKSLDAKTGAMETQAREIIAEFEKHKNLLTTGHNAALDTLAGKLTKKIDLLNRMRGDARTAYDIHIVDNPNTVPGGLSINTLGNNLRQDLLSVTAAIGSKTIDPELLRTIENKYAGYPGQFDRIESQVNKLALLPENADYLKYEINALRELHNSLTSSIERARELHQSNLSDFEKLKERLINLDSQAKKLPDTLPKISDEKFWGSIEVARGELSGLSKTSEAIIIEPKKFNEAQIAELKNLHSTARSSIKKASDAINTLEHDYITTLTSNIDGLQAQINSDQGKLQKEITSNGFIIEASEPLLVTLETKVPDYNSQKQRHTAEFNDIPERLKNDTLKANVALLNTTSTQHNDSIVAARMNFYLYNLPALIKRTIPPEFKDAAPGELKIKANILGDVKIAKVRTKTLGLSFHELTHQDPAFRNALFTMINDTAKLVDVNQKVAEEKPNSPFCAVQDAPKLYADIQMNGADKFKDKFILDAKIMLNNKYDVAVNSLKTMKKNPSLKALQTQNPTIQELNIENFNSFKECASTLEDFKKNITAINEKDDNAIQQILTLRNQEFPKIKVREFLGNCIDALSATVTQLTSTLPDINTVSLDTFNAGIISALNSLANAKQNILLLAKLIDSWRMNSNADPKLNEFIKQINDASALIESRIRERLASDITILSGKIAAEAQKLLSHETNNNIDLPVLNTIKMNSANFQRETTELLARANKLSDKDDPAGKPNLDKANLTADATALQSGLATLNATIKEAEALLAEIKKLDDGIKGMISPPLKVDEIKRGPVLKGTNKGEITFQLDASADPGLSYAFHKVFTPLAIPSPIPTVPEPFTGNLADYSRLLKDNGGQFNQFYNEYYLRALPDLIKSRVPDALKTAGAFAPLYIANILPTNNGLEFKGVKDTAFYNALGTGLGTPLFNAADPTKPLEAKEQSFTLPIANPAQIYQKITAAPRNQFEDTFVINAKPDLRGRYESAREKIQALPTDKEHFDNIVNNPKYQTCMGALNRFRAEIDTAKTAKKIVELRKRDLPGLVADINKAITDPTLAPAPPPPPPAKPAAAKPPARTPAAFNPLLSIHQHLEIQSAYGLPKTKETIRNLLALAQEVRDAGSAKPGEAPHEHMQRLIQTMCKLKKQDHPSMVVMQKTLTEYGPALLAFINSVQTPPSNLTARTRGAWEEDRNLALQLKTLYDTFVTDQAQVKMNNLYSQSVNFNQNVPLSTSTAQWGANRLSQTQQSQWFTNAANAPDKAMQLSGVTSGSYTQGQVIPTGMKNLNEIHGIPYDPTKTQAENNKRTAEGIIIGEKLSDKAPRTYSPPAAFDPVYIFTRAASNYLGSQGLKDPNLATGAVPKSTATLLEEMVRALDKKPITPTSISNYLSKKVKSGQLEVGNKDWRIDAHGLASALARAYKEAMDPVALHITAARIVYQELLDQGVDVTKPEQLKTGFIRPTGNISRELTQAIANVCAYKGLEKNFSVGNKDYQGMTGKPDIVHNLLGQELYKQAGHQVFKMRDPLTPPGALELALDPYTARAITKPLEIAKPVVTPPAGSLEALKQTHTDQLENLRAQQLAQQREVQARHEKINNTCSLYFDLERKKDNNNPDPIKDVQNQENTNLKQLYENKKADHVDALKNLPSSPVSPEEQKMFNEHTCEITKLDAEYTKEAKKLDTAHQNFNTLYKQYAHEHLNPYAPQNLGQDQRHEISSMKARHHAELEKLLGDQKAEIINFGSAPAPAPALSLTTSPPRGKVISPHAAPSTTTSAALSLSAGAAIPSASPLPPPPPQPLEPSVSSESRYGDDALGALRALGTREHNNDEPSRSMSTMPVYNDDPGSVSLDDIDASTSLVSDALRVLSNNLKHWSENTDKDKYIVGIPNDDKPTAQATRDNIIQEFKEMGISNEDTRGKIGITSEIVKNEHGEEVEGSIIAIDKDLIKENVEKIIEKINEKIDAIVIGGAMGLDPGPHESIISSLCNRVANSADQLKREVNETSSFTKKTGYN